MARTRSGRGGRGGRGGRAAPGAQANAPEMEAAPAWFTAFMNPLMARVEQLEAAQAANVVQNVGVEPVIPAPPPPQPDMVAPVVAHTTQGDWLKLLNQYEKSKPKIFNGETDGITAQTWKDDMRRLLIALDANEVQKQRLVGFSLKGDAGRWYDNLWTPEQKLTATWEQFEAEFDRQYISDAVKSLRMNEFLTLRQGDMSVTEYERKFNMLASFATDLRLPESAKARLFEDKLNSKYKNLVLAQCLNTLREVVDSARIIERNPEEEQKGREAQAQVKAKADDKAKGKRPAQDVETGKAQNGGDAKRPKFQQQRNHFKNGECFNCGEKGHQKKDCPKPLKQGNGNRGHGNGQGQRGGDNRQGQQPFGQQRQYAPPVAHLHAMY